MFQPISGPEKPSPRNEFTPLRTVMLPSPIPATRFFASHHDTFEVPFPSDEIHLWLISVSADDPTLHSCFDSLTSDETLRARRFLSEPTRRRFIITRAALRRILRGYHDKLPTDFPISTGTFGKPFLESAELKAPLHFNVSHSGDLALMGFCVRAEIGVDIEEERRLTGLVEIGKKVFSEREFSFLQTLPESERRTAFFQLWTCKEASLKAEGTGFNRDPRSICLFSEAKSRNEISRLIHMDGQSIQWATPPSGYSLAWAFQSTESPKVRWIQT